MNIIAKASPSVFTPDIIKHLCFGPQAMFQNRFCSNIKMSNAMGESHLLQQVTKQNFQLKTKKTGNVQCIFHICQLSEVFSKVTVL